MKRVVLIGGVAAVAAVAAVVASVDLEWNDTVDLTAVGTLALAIATFISLVVAGLALRQTKDEIRLSRQEVEEAHRPVLVPAPLSRPTIGGDDELVVPVRNVGMGPALHIEAWAKLLDADGKPSPAQAGEQTPATVAGLGSDNETPLRIKPSRWSADASFELTVVYQDVARKPWRTTCRWIENSGYEGLAIDRA